MLLSKKKAAKKEAVATKGNVSMPASEEEITVATAAAEYAMNTLLLEEDGGQSGHATKAPKESTRKHKKNSNKNMNLG